MNLVGLSAFFHDSAVALLREGRIVAAAQEERFSREKGDESFPTHALKYILESSQLRLSDIDALVYYEKPWLAFSRLVETSLQNAPHGLIGFLASMPPWLSWKLNVRSTIRRELAGFDIKNMPKILFSSHHLSHAASAFYPSPFESAAVICLDGVGEDATTSVWLGQGRELKPLWEIRFPHSVGLLYATFTWFCGFKINSGEYKLMGLAPFGTPRFQEIIEKELISIRDDGTFRLNMKYFGYHRGLSMITKDFENLFGVGPRTFEGPMLDIYKDLAASVQAVTEKIIVRLAQTVRTETGMENLCMAGGVALNCVANGKIQAAGLFKNIFIQPAAGDAGGALGAALAAWHLHFEKSREVSLMKDQMSAALLGPEFDNQQIEQALIKENLSFQKLELSDLSRSTAKLLSSGKIVGWFQGRMEFGPRALGARSILGDPRNPEMKKVMNMKIKFREGFRPFAPIVMSERKQDYFNLNVESPYMLFTAQSKNPNDLPAVTHVDRSARIQTVDAQDHPRLHQLLKDFEADTGCGVLVNTSFNVRGEPIVMDPSHAVNCFLNTDIDALVIGDYLVEKSANRSIRKDRQWRSRFALD